VRFTWSIRSPPDISGPGNGSGNTIVNASKTRGTGLSMQFGTGVKSGTYETLTAEKQDFATIIAYFMHIT
jgi:hypothetical protein